jgi:5-(aminomethyl)-3-furanmethanol phosphate kinase
MSLDAILKIGGSLSRGNGLAALCLEISRLGRRRPLLVVPGGGEFADLVRKIFARYALSDSTAHCMALLAMDQYGYVLNQMIPGSSRAKDLAEARRIAESGSPSILLPSAEILHADPLPHSWAVTSDTIAAWVAYATGCRRLVLLKDVDGVFMDKEAAGHPDELIAELTVEQLSKIDGGVDRQLSRFLACTPLETWVISGLHPERLVELMDTGRTTGTCIDTSAYCP